MSGLIKLFKQEPALFYFQGLPKRNYFNHDSIIIFIAMEFDINTIKRV